MAGFGTAGCVLACAAALFAIAGAVVSFRGWPQIGGEGSPAVTVTPGPGSRPRGAVPGLGATFVTTVVPGAHSVRRTGGVGAGGANGGPVTQDAGRLGPQLPTQAGSGRPTGSGGGPIGTGGGPTGTGGGPTGPGGGPPTPTPPPTDPPVGTPRPGGPGPVIDRVSAAAGDAVSGAGSRIGSAVGGSAGAALTKIAGGAGGAVSKLGAGVGNLLGS